MSIVKAPFFGLSATKTLGKKIIFVRSKSRNIAKKHFKPTDPKTAFQHRIRSDFRHLNFIYTQPPLNDLDKKCWDYKAKILSPGAHGRNMWVAFYMKPATGLPIGTIHSMIFTLDPLPFTIHVFPSHPADVHFRIIRGPHSGYLQIKPPIPHMPTSFIAPWIEPKDICCISSDPSLVYASTGYFPLNPSWFV